MAETTHAETQASDAPHGGGHGSFPPFDASTFPSQLVWLAIAFVALYLLMSRLALPRVASILKDRESRLAGDLAAAGQLKARTDSAIAAYEKALADAKAKAQAIAAENRDKLAAESEAKRKSVEAGLAQKLEAAEQMIAQKRGEAMSNVHAIAADAVGAILHQLIGRAPGKDEIDRALAKLSDR